MNHMIKEFTQYLSRSDSQGFWILCDGNVVTGERKDDMHWLVNVGFWNDVKNSHVLTKDDILHHINLMIDVYGYATYKLYEAPDKWSEDQINKFMENLALDMCKPDFRGFTLSAKNTIPFVVLYNPYGFFSWKVNSQPANYSDVLEATRKKLEEKVFWEYTPT